MAAAPDEPDPVLTPFGNKILDGDYDPDADRFDWNTVAGDVRS